MFYRGLHGDIGRQVRNHYIIILLFIILYFFHYYYDLFRADYINPAAQKLSSSLGLN